MSWDQVAWRRLAARQDGVAASAQLLALGMTRSRIARRAATGQWQRLHPGVYVLHSGPVSWRTRARGALLYTGLRAALSHDSAGYVHGILDRPPRTIDVSMPASRRVVGQPGIEIHRRRHMPEVRGSLPAVVAAETLLDVLQRAGRQDEKVRLVCSAVRAGSEPSDLLEALARRRAVRGRPLLLELVSAVEDGVESPLEHRYHRDVGRRHGLPPAARQVRQAVGGWWIRADAIYQGLGVRVELDGELAHPGGRTDSDTWRDNAVLIDRSEITLRYRWSHVLDPCRTADQVGAALRARGWTGAIRRCGPRCDVGRTVHR